MNYPFLAALAEVLEDAFDVLHPQYVEEKAAEVERELGERIDGDYETRYVLISAVPGQLTTRRLFGSSAETERAAREWGYDEGQVATVIIKI